MHTDDRIDLVSNNTKDIEQFRARYSYGDNKNANMPSDKKAYHYRHRFGMSFNEVGLLSSNDFVHGIQWGPCEEFNGNLNSCFVLFTFKVFNC